MDAGGAPLGPTWKKFSSFRKGERERERGDESRDTTPGESSSIWGPTTAVAWRPSCSRHNEVTGVGPFGHPVADRQPDTVQWSDRIRTFCLLMRVESAHLHLPGASRII
uniref:Uncharacterized protein n=1 Tax=Trichuris muris TaxID=70415 RepID=A0A5S6R1B3_TRIMR